MAKPVANIPTLANYLVNGYWNNFDHSGPHHWVEAGHADHTITVNITALNATEQGLAKAALSAWHQVANISFTFTTLAAQITYDHNDSMGAVTNANYPLGQMTDADVHIPTNWGFGDFGIDSYTFQTYVHETGHALGLGHQGPYNTNANYNNDAIYANDTWQYSTMSYFPQSYFGGASARYAVTPQMADIYAIQHVYGAQTHTRTDNTVYGFHSNAGAVYDFTKYAHDQNTSLIVSGANVSDNGAPAFTIYDSGGHDTLNCSGYGVAETINLTPGSFSSIGGEVKNIGIYLTTVIENAVGGSGADHMIGDSVANSLSGGAGKDLIQSGDGADLLNGGGSSDRLYGGAKADHFIFTGSAQSPAGANHDFIFDFSEAQKDKIDLRNFDASAAPGHQHFHFIGAAAFSHHAGQLRSNGHLVQGDTDGDGTANFEVHVNLVKLLGGDFLL
jgi:serralysin